MSDATDLWAAVVASYDNLGLVSLSNINTNSATSIDTTMGESAAQGVIDLWPAYAQANYDGSNALHVEVAKQGVIAMLWRRGGSSTTIEQVKWEEVFGDEGLISRVRRTGPRGHQGPSSNSGVKQSSELVRGQQVLGWSDPTGLPVNFLPSRRTASDV